MLYLALFKLRLMVLCLVERSLFEMVRDHVRLWSLLLLSAEITSIIVATRCLWTLSVYLPGTTSVGDGLIVT